MDDNYKTPLISAAIAMAARTQTLSDDAIFHSDRGSNYTSADFAETLKSLKIKQSVGLTGICYNNAMAESFFAALKNERVHRTEYPTLEHARQDIADPSSMDSSLNHCPETPGLTTRCRFRTPVFRIKRSAKGSCGFPACSLSANSRVSSIVMTNSGTLTDGLHSFGMSGVDLL